MYFVICNKSGGPQRLVKNPKGNYKLYKGMKQKAEAERCCLCCSAAASSARHNVCLGRWLLSTFNSSSAPTSTTRIAATWPPHGEQKAGSILSTHLQMNIERQCTKESKAYMGDLVCLRPPAFTCPGPG